MSQSPIPLIGRLLELWTGDCPPERPCRPEDIAAFRAHVAGDQPAETPGLVTQATNFAEATAKHVAAGGGRVSLQVHDTRRAICDACIHRDSEKDSCKVCGCPLEKGLLQKLWMPTEQCPKAFWAQAPAESS